METKLQTSAIGYYLMNRRLQLSQSRSETAKLARISTAYYGAVEREDIIPTNSTFDQILAALQFDEKTSQHLREQIALQKGLTAEDAGLPDEVSALICEIRKLALVLPPQFVRGLRARIRESIT